MTEKQLVENILNGDESALRFFYRQHKDRLMFFIRRQIDSNEDCEEILQDAFMDCLEGLRDFTFKSSIHTYICAIAKYKIIDFYRKKRVKTILFSQLPENIKPFISQLLSPDEQFEVVETRIKISRIFSLLKPIYSKVLILKYHQGFSVKEIAKNQLLTIKSVESLLVRARRQFIKKYQIDYV